MYTPQKWCPTLYIHLNYITQLTNEVIQTQYYFQWCHLAQMFAPCKYLWFQGCDLDLYRFVPTGYLDLQVRFPTGIPTGLPASTHRYPGLVTCLSIARPHPSWSP